MARSSNHRWKVIAAVVLAFGVAAIWSTREDADQAKLAKDLARKVESPTPTVVESNAEPDVVRLSSKLVAQKDVLPGAWVLQRDDQPRPRMILPFESLEDGPLSEKLAEQGSERWSNEAGYLGADACAACHLERHQGFVMTAHHQTSSLGSAKQIHGALTSPANELPTSDPELSLTMHERGDSAIQRVSFHGWNVDIPMDVVTGSGKVAQTFLYWDNDRLFQAFASYFSGPDKWLTSPGFDELDVNLGRVIRTECLECHVTYIEQTEPPNHYRRSSAIWGISCERCHGPGRKHVEYHQANPELKQARHIVHPSDLPRERQLDVCGQCHSGAFDLKKPAFSFRPGDDLTQYHRLLKPEFDDSGIHTSNQLARLRLSECFEQSQMTCTDCHDPHVAQRGNEVFFREACLKCHEVEHCGLQPELSADVAGKCVECHMPSTAIDDLAGMKLQGLTLSMADHFIRVDRDHADEVIDRSNDSTE
ncbi:cytochrome C [Rhodopirellula sp. JC740]|uniref:Cytochrome C n=1 Tax=Rhodopirellula halodulae TaxID=2894198 RepID=A0ABS8NGM2_9BACT|nr:multiheme c-type cytochrome [Rhodopirellula sp. JC740]MCC9642097.1 cytochrome C [Rhodopirellula sp. JC740]